MLKNFSTPHFCVNLLVQILLGFPLEVIHSWKRIIIIYYVGGLLSSLIAGAWDFVNTPLTGATGGVYSLLFSHIPYIIIVRIA